MVVATLFDMYDSWNFCYNFFFLIYRLRNVVITVARSTVADTSTLSVVPTVLAVLLRIRQSRNLSSATLLKLLLSGISLKPVSILVSVLYHWRCQTDITFIIFHRIPAAEAVCQVALLCVLRHPLQGCTQSFPGRQEDSYSSPKVSSSYCKLKQPFFCFLSIQFTFSIQDNRQQGTGGGPPRR